MRTPEAQADPPAKVLGSVPPQVPSVPAQVTCVLGQAIGETQDPLSGPYQVPLLHWNCALPVLPLLEAAVPVTPLLAPPI